MQSSACNQRYVRVQKTVAGVTHDYIVDGATILAEITPDYTLRFIYDENGSPIGFVYTPTGSASATYYYEKNLFGDVVNIWEDTGSSLVKVGTYAFNAYGQNVKVTNLTGGTYSNIASLNPFRYRSYYYDADLYLYHLQSRYFDPVSCRFISADGQLNGGNTILGYNMYAYCGNDPINRTDSTGAFWDTVFDVVSLAMSVAEVAATPTNPWAWAGMVGDIADLIPFVSGVGEVTKALGAAKKAGELIDDVHDAKKAQKAIENMAELAEAGQDGFKTFKTAKKNMEAATNIEWHHIVEQSQIGRSGFAKTSINNSSNLVGISSDLHHKISAIYSGKPTFLTNPEQYKTVRDWVSTLNYQQQYTFGVFILQIAKYMP